MFKNIFLGALVFALAWGGFMPLNVGATGAVISLSSATVTAGEQATVTVSLTGVTDMVGFRIGVTWPQELDYVSGSMALTSDTAGFMIVTNENVADYAGNGVLSSAASAYAVSGSLNLITFRLLVPAGTAAGSYTLTVDSKTRLNDGAIPVTFQNGTITVTASPAPPPPPTYPDLIVNTITLMQDSTTILSGNPQAGQPFYVKANFSNTGEAAASTPFYINVYVDSVLNSHLAVSSALANSTSANIISNAVTLSSVGNHLISITIDSKNSVTESNENNNTLNQTIAVVAAPVSGNSATTTPNNTTNSSGGSTSGGGFSSSYLGQPDLMISEIDFNPTYPKQNETYTGRLQISVQNIGQGATNNAEGIRVGASLTKENGALVNWSGADSYTYISNLTVGGISVTALDLKNVLFDTNKITVNVWVDNVENSTTPNGFIEESNESNNTYTKKIDIKGCREFTPVSPEVEKECIAKGGKMVGGKDANGCAIPPKCVIPNECPKWVSYPEAEQECFEKGGKMVGGKDANGCAIPPKCVIKVCTPDYNPICGTIEGEKKTYGNKCELERKGATALYAGPCRGEKSGHGFSSAYWQCYDGTEATLGGDNSCKSSEAWQEQAVKFCYNHCYADKSKCGVNTFRVEGECDSIQPAPTITEPADEAARRIIKLERLISQLEQKVIEMEKNLVTRIDQTIVNRVKGKILLQTQANGEAWYVDPNSENKFYMQDGGAAYDIMRALGLGITNKNLETIPIGIQDKIYTLTDTDGDGIPDNLEVALGTDPSKADTDGDGYNDKAEILSGYKPNSTSGKYTYNQKLIDRLKGRIALQVESHGEAWYINPNDGKRYYLGDGNTAYNVMRFLSLGIKNDDLRKIQVGEFSE